MTSPSLRADGSCECAPNDKLRNNDAKPHPSACRASFAGVSFCRRVGLATDGRAELRDSVIRLLSRVTPEPVIGPRVARTRWANSPALRPSIEARARNQVHHGSHVTAIDRDFIAID